MELILDKTIIPMLDRTAGMGFLRENGVAKVHKLDPTQLEISSDCDKRLYMLRTDMNNIIAAIKQISHDQRVRVSGRKYVVPLLSNSFFY